MDTVNPKRMALKLTQGDIEDLKKQGYTDGEIHEALREVEKEELNSSYNEVQQRRGVDPRQNSQISSFSSKQNDDIVRWQLELNDILERAEHILRGDIPTFRDGHIVWERNPNPENNPLNNVGVQEVMKVLAMYINRNTILSDYTNEEINFKVFDFGRAINNLIFMRDHEFGMDTDEKRKNYEMLVTELKDIVHSSYKRALDGAEKRSLREMISVSQATSTSAQLGSGLTINNQGQVSKERGLLNPNRYIKGKYV
jgi:hypothetical protein